MGGFFCSIGVQRCIASRFSTTSQARLISNQILLLNYFPLSQACGGLFRQCNEQVYQSELAQVSSPQAGGGLFRPGRSDRKQHQHPLQLHLEREEYSLESSLDRGPLRAFLAPM